ncbi:MAG: xanthine dehydrogenase family protein molybdopterin-binding subunit [Acidobacteriota bacterium]
MDRKYLEEVKKLLGRDHYKIVGTDVQRVDGLEKVTGQAKYTADFLIENALTVRPVWSRHPHALIRKIDKAPALRVAGVECVITGADIPGENQCGYYTDDQPFIASDKVRHVGDIVALVVARDAEAAWAGADAVIVEYEELPGVFEPKAALAGTFNIHDEKSPGGVKIRKGDVEQAFRECDLIVERTYIAGSQDHAYLEPEAAIGIPEGRQGMTVISTNQNPFRTRNTVARVLGRPQSEVRIITPYLGGGFGGKDTYGPIISTMAAVAAEHTGRAAMIVFTRYESFAYRYKRCPFEIRYKSGATKDGKLKAIEVEYTCDCGGYSAHVLGLMKRAAYHATGVYEVPNCKVTGVAVYTNNVPVAAFNGFGNPQMGFAIESQIDLLAEGLNIDPVEFRLNNALVPGSHTGTGQLLDHSVGIKELIEKVAQRADWKSKRRKTEETRKGAKKRGVGMGCSWHGCGTTGLKHDWAGASVILQRDGSVNYCTGIVEIGQGTITSHAMMVAETLGIPYAWVKVDANDTSRMPDSGETHAQRGTFIGGTAAVDAALKLRERLNALAATMLGCERAEVVIEEGLVHRRNDASRKLPFKDLVTGMYERGMNPAEYGFIKAKRDYPDPETGQGVPYAAYTFGCTVAEVEVDVETGQVEVLKLYPGIAAGKIIQPDIVRGQVNGCGVLGLGYGLMETVVREEGRMVNDSFGDYMIPTILDKPEMEPYVMVEDEYKYSGFGAKGVGEIALISTPLAIANAVFAATGTRYYSLPLSPEQVYLGLRKG